MELCRLVHKISLVFYIFTFLYFHIFYILFYIPIFPQSTGWPGTVAVMGNWFGIKRRGLFMGVWNAHTSVGNILGTVIPAFWVGPDRPWYGTTCVL